MGAESLYLDLLKTHPKDPHILSNLALLKIQEGKAWHAFALWQKALHYHPYFAAAKQGIAYLEEQGAIIPQENWPWYARLYSDILRAPKIIGLGLAFIFFYLAARILLKFAILQKEAREIQEEDPNFPYRSLVFLALFAIFAVFYWQQSSYQKTTFAMSLEPASMLLAPRQESVQLKELGPGQKLQIQHQNKDWLQVKSASGQIGWLPREKLLIF
mgnify:CR=1 FL=1